MSDYDNPTEQVVSTVLAEYDLGGLMRCASVERGYVNEKWLLETETGQYLLKRRHASLRGPCLVQAQHALVRHLCNKGFPAPGLAHTRDGDINPVLPSASQEVTAHTRAGG